MARCPFASIQMIGYDAGPYVPAPFRIVLHSTEGSHIEQALKEFHQHRYASHFVVDDKQIVQLIDTGVASCALKNLPGGVETDRMGAIQIEMVAFAGKPKSPALLANVAKLCRWIEAEHKVPQEWPNGFCKPAVNGKDGNKHNRDAKTWTTKGGYYGHEHVPENFHWDPALTIDETKLITPAAVPPVHWT